jgi:hypothetical protein
VLTGLQYSGGHMPYQLPSTVTFNPDGSLHPQAQILLAALAAQVRAMKPIPEEQDWEALLCCCFSGSWLGIFCGQTTVQCQPHNDCSSVMRPLCNGQHKSFQATGR